MNLLFANAHFEMGRESGARTHIENLIRELQRLGHQVWVSRDSETETGHRLPSRGIQRSRVLRELDAVYLRFEGQPVRLSRLLRIELALWAGKKPVIWEMNATSDYCALMWRAEGRIVDVNRLDHKIRREAKRVRLAICNTRGLEQYARMLGIRRSVVIPLGSDPELFSADVPCCQEVRGQLSDVNVVWCGSPEIRWHDIDSIVATARLLRNDHRIRFFVVGKMKQPPSCPDNITFLGEIARSRLPSVLSCMDVGLALYHEPSWSRFGVYSSPLKIFDYMASGLLVMASPIEQVLEIVREDETGFLIPYGKSEELAARLSKIADRGAGSQEAIGLTARQLVVQYYNWKRVAEETALEITAAI